MHFKLKIVLLPIILSLVLITNSWAALEIDRGPVYWLLRKALPFKNLELAGYLKNETALRTAHGLDEFMKQAIVEQLEAEYKFNDNMQFFTILKWFNDFTFDLENKYDSDSKWESKSDQKLRYPEKMQWLRECYLDVLTDRLDLRLGKQQVVWGTADGERILDLVNPLDYREWTLKDYIDIMDKKKHYYLWLSQKIADIDGITILWPKLPEGIVPFCLSVFIESSRDGFLNELRKKYDVMAWPTLSRLVLDRLEDFPEIEIMGRKLLQINLPAEKVRSVKFGVYLDRLVDDLHNLARKYLPKK